MLNFAICYDISGLTPDKYIILMDDNKPYIVSARKYRPATFASVVGQKALTSTLKNACSSGRVAQAYLFCGPRGVGKTSCARIFAKTLNCLNLTPDGEACGECEACRAADRGNSFNLLELDAASNNSVNDIRDITDQVNVPPQKGRYRVFIIDEVHMLSSAAFNAFLKTLEEPPKHVVFILATTEKHKILPTILSRCQVYDFNRITVDDMVEHLRSVAAAEGIEAEDEALDVIAQKADGAMRDALSIFDQVAASCMGHITYAGAIANLNVLDYDYYFRLADAFEAGDVGSALLIYNEVRDKGFDSLFFVGGLARHLRDLMVAADQRTVQLLEASKSVAERYCRQAALFSPAWYYHALNILNECDVNYRTTASKQLVVELALVKICALRNAAMREPMAPPPPSAAPAPKPESRPAASQQSQPARPQPAPQSSPQPRPSAPQPQAHQQAAPRTAPRAVAPRAAARPATAAPRASAGGPVAPALGVRLHDDAPEGEGDAPGPARQDKPAAAAERPITRDSLMEAWTQFTVSHPEHKIVVNTMTSAVPECVEGGVYAIHVANEGQRRQFDAVMPQLVGFMRERLHNSSFVLKVNLMEADSSHRQLTPREFLTKAVTENAPLSHLMDVLDAELC